MINLKSFLPLVAALSISLTAITAPTQAVPDANSTARVQWWRDAKFGLFITWGLYAIPARGEWVQWNEQIPVHEYAKLADQLRRPISHPRLGRNSPKRQA